VTVVDHRADDAATMTKVSDDPPVSVNGLFANADFRIVTGLIEPHFMAGFSGGRKGVCPALVDLNTIQRFHGYPTLSHPNAENGVLADNPCHDEALRVARLVGVDFLLNVAITDDRDLAGVYAGDMEQAHAAGCEQVERWTRATIDEPFDLVITNGGGYPLDATYYQTVKGMVAALPALTEGSTLLIASECREGIGSPEYTDTMMRWCHDWRGFLEHIAATDRVTKDQWQYQMQTRVLARVGVDRLRLVSDGLAPEAQAKLAVNPVQGDAPAADRVQAFVDRFVKERPGARLAIVPEGPYTMLARAAVPAGA
jgi:nickel-dependent lactate racemase